MALPPYYVFPGIDMPQATGTGSSKRVNAELKFLPTRAEMDFIVGLVATERGCTAADITGPSRKFEIVTTRHIISKILRETFVDKRRGVFYKVGTKLIGKVLGYRDHSTIVNGLKSFNNLYDTERDMREGYHELQHKVIEAIKGRRKAQVMMN
jgi:chromosomal replication initiation ATPase DnaA